jgi:hypothetical protein
MVDEKSWCDLLWLPISYSFCVLVGFYFFEQIAKSIRVFVTRRIEPKWLNVIGVNDTIQTSVLKDVIEDKSRSEKELEEVNDRISTLSRELDRLRKENQEMVTEQASQLKTISTLTEEKNMHISLANKSILDIDRFSPVNKITIFEFPMSITSADFKKLWLTSPNLFPSVLTPVDSIIGRFISLRTDESDKFTGIVFDYEIPIEVNLSSGMLELIIRSNDSYTVYLKLQVRGSSKNFWFLYNVNYQGNMRNEGAPQNEYRIKTQNNEIANGWFSLKTKIEEDFYSTFGKENLLLERIKGFKIRGEIDIARIRIYQ